MKREGLNVLTVLQCCNGFTLFTVVTVSNIISGLHSELIGGEGLQSEIKITHMSQNTGCSEYALRKASIKLQ